MDINDIPLEYMGQNAGIVLNFQILFAHDDFLHELEKQEENRGFGVQSPTAKLSARLLRLFLHTQHGIKRWGVYDVTQIKKDILSQNYEKIISAYEVISEWLDLAKITRVDNKQQYDRSRWESENKAQEE